MRSNKFEIFHRNKILEMQKKVGMDCLQVKISDFGMSKLLALIVSLPVEPRQLNTDINN